MSYTEIYGMKNTNIVLKLLFIWLENISSFTFQPYCMIHQLIDWIS